MSAENEETLEYETFQIPSFDAKADAAQRLPAPSPSTSFDPSPLPGPPPGEGAAGFEEASADRRETETDFASIKFQRENTLLTNAERYAASIREEAELYVHQLRSEVQALNNQAEARYEEAREVKETSEQDAKTRIAVAEDQVEEIRSQAYNEGFEAGRREGLEKRYEEAGPSVTNLQRVLEELTQFRRQVDFFMEKDGVRLAVLMAKKILFQELKTNKKVVWKLLAATLAKLEGQGNFRIWVSPEDFKFASAARPELEKFLDEDQTVTFRPRVGLGPGNTMIETDREVIDLTIGSQLHHLERLLNTTLGERETAVTHRPPPPPPAPAQPAGEQGAPQGQSEPAAMAPPSGEPVPADSGQQPDTAPPTEAPPAVTAPAEAAPDGEAPPEPEAAPGAGPAQAATDTEFPAPAAVDAAEQPAGENGNG